MGCNHPGTCQSPICCGCMVTGTSFFFNYFFHNGSSPKTKLGYIQRCPNCPWFQYSTEGEAKVLERRPQPLKLSYSGPGKLWRGSWFALLLSRYFLFYNSASDRTCSLVVRPRLTRTMWKPVRPKMGMKRRAITHSRTMETITSGCQKKHVWD